MIVGFAGNLEKPGIAEIRSKLMAQAERLGCECVAFDSVEAVRLTRLAPELLVVIGGDGSLLRFAFVAAGRNLPILGVNLAESDF
jgi:NAD kinase